MGGGGITKRGKAVRLQHTADPYVRRMSCRVVVTQQLKAISSTPSVTFPLV